MEGISGNLNCKLQCARSIVSSIVKEDGLPTEENTPNDCFIPLNRDYKLPIVTFPLPSRTVTDPCVPPTKTPVMHGRQSLTGNGGGGNSVINQGIKVTGAGRSTLTT